MKIRTRNRIAQTTAFWLFRFATYAILAAATYIFLDIGIKGSRTLFTTHAPFINVPFFTQGPQTLFVFDYEGKKYTLSDREFRAWKKEHPVEVEATSVAYSAGGVWPCIVGTGLLVIGSMIVALAVGICSAIYLSEYSQNTRSIRLDSYRDSQPRRRALDCFRTVRLRLVRDFFPLERVAPGRLVHPRPHDSAGHHHRE